MPYQTGKVLLDCLLDANLEVTYMCRKALCGSCMVMKLRGDVEMLKNKALSARDLENGYVLMCQSIPVSADVHIDCDGD